MRIINMLYFYFYKYIVMENLEQQESLPITEQQIEEFLWLYKKFSGKWRKVKIDGHETTFKSYEKNGNKCINVKNIFIDYTRIYDWNGTISITRGVGESGLRSRGEDWPLDQEKLSHDLNWFQDCVPSLMQKISRRFEGEVGRGLIGKKSWS